MEKDQGVLVLLQNSRNTIALERLVQQRKRPQMPEGGEIGASVREMLFSYSLKYRRSHSLTYPMRKKKKKKKEVAASLFLFLSFV